MCPIQLKYGQTAQAMSRQLWRARADHCLPDQALKLMNMPVTILALSMKCPGCNIAIELLHVIVVTSSTSVSAASLKALLLRSVMVAENSKTIVDCEAPAMLLKTQNCSSFFVEDAHRRCHHRKGSHSPDLTMTCVFELANLVVSLPPLHRHFHRPLRFQAFRTTRSTRLFRSSTHPQYLRHQTPRCHLSQACSVVVYSLCQRRAFFSLHCHRLS